MKNIFKITTVSALVMLSANAMAVDATQDFTWTGTVPADVTSGIKIKDLSSSTTLDSGVFELTKVDDFSTGKGKFNIVSPSILSFDVVTDDASENHVDYYYTLTDFVYSSSDGLANGANISSVYLTGVDLMADGAPLQEDVKSPVAATSPTDLTLDGYGTFSYGVEYSIQATMLITDQAI
ncbi:hypothetical protein Sps_03953 [Shewanella psychrophila]|uniref:Common pilus major fimbrillin subunit EcpA n=1 Tax=Shewanella psychrophila TaxID=225848 RepID=A0A1S6HUH5_9GAMM|nr:hypothetical protein [Shewanella psychrophila]AQS39068.1 hypothetical protein Sps_03953 [Shewanella psychrophila]